MTENPAAVLDGAVLRLGMPEDEYHRHPALSSTGARRILESPARFRVMQLLPAEPKKEFDLGTAVHTAILGTGAPMVEIPDDVLASNGAASTKKAKGFIEEARAAGKVPLKSGPFRMITGAVESVLAHAEARGWLEQEGPSEASLFARDPETGVHVRARFDRLSQIPVDVKTTSKELGASPGEFARAVARLGYDVQAEHYADVHEFAFGVRPEQFTFVVVELMPPFLVGVYQLSEAWRRMGRGKARRAREVFAECLSSGVWPGYPAEVQLLEPPRWAEIEFEREYA